jgi:S-DNA-T family DNA segregation ATPase FtsK/SpoIIIE
MDAQVNQLNIALADLKIAGTCVGFKQHRHLAFYDVKLDSGVSATVRRIENRTREIALRLKTQTAPIVQVLPRDGVVRLRVALYEAESLPFRDIYNVADAPVDYFLPILMGESDEGKRVWVDLARHPHTLIAGSTGSGKSVFLHTLIANLASLSASGRKIQVYLSDPKRVEFSSFGSLDMVMSVTHDYRSALDMLEYLNEIMEARYSTLSSLKLTSVERARPGLFAPIVVIIDEVADLMMQDKRAGVFEKMLVRLAQKCRAAGIYLVLATQRPSVDVLTGLIKANFPARISFKVGQRVDSQVILDSPGAEALLGRGDAILQSPVIDRVRFQAPYSEAMEIVEEYGKAA